MARTPSVSDTEIFEAATRVIRLRGPDAFTLSEVATETGLSRAAIILRFNSTQGLKTQVLQRMVEAFRQRLDLLPTTPSGDHLLQVAAFIGETAGSRESSASFFASYAERIQQKELLALERQRGELLNKAISRVMPDTPIERQSAVALFTAHLTGSIISCIGSGHSDTRGYLVKRTKDWLRLVGIPFQENAIYEPRPDE